MPKIKNIIIFVVIAGALIFAYIYFVQPSFTGQNTDLVSQSSTSSDLGSTTNASTGDTSAVAGNFLTLLLGVKTIQLNTDIFSDPAFLSLHDSSIVLVPDTAIGRANPFAQFGAENVATTPSTTPPPTTTGTSSSTLSIPVVPATGTSTSSKTTTSSKP